MTYKGVCPYCGGKPELKDSDLIYGRSYGPAYICSNYPTCDAYVGVHKSTNEPLGTLANYDLRKLRKMCHSLFDPLWKSGPSRTFRRKEAYAWLADKLGIDEKHMHFAQFDEDQCKTAIRILTETAKEKEELENTNKLCETLSQTAFDIDMCNP